MDVGTGQVAAEAVALYGHIGKAGLSKEGGQGGVLNHHFANLFWEKSPSPHHLEVTK